MPKHGKKFREALSLVDPQTIYSPQEAVALVKRAAYAKFDETVEVHLRMNVDPRQADQQLRGVVSLPAGTGKTVRILVFAEGEAAREAEAAGADYVGVDEYVQRIQDGWLEFDVAVAIPQVMGRIGRLGRVLGPRGMMPNPRAGTVVQPDDIGRTIGELRGGRVEYRIDRTANLHIPIGKVRFEDEALLANWAAVMDAIVRARPAAVRGQYIRSVTLASTMGPGVSVDINAARDMRPA
jgi:large subunit ribosomal protein L1